MTRRSAAFLAFMLAAAPASAIAASPAAATNAPLPATELPASSLELARQIWDIALPPEHRLAMFAGVMRSVADQMSPSALSDISDGELRAIIENKIAAIPDRLMPVTEKHIPAMMESYARAYAREFSGDELQQILTFARTPAGGRYLSRSSAVLEDPDVAAVNRAYYADVKVVQDELTQEIVSIILSRQDMSADSPESEK